MARPSGARRRGAGRDRASCPALVSTTTAPRAGRMTPASPRGASPLTEPRWGGCPGWSLRGDGRLAAEFVHELDEGAVAPDAAQVRVAGHVPEECPGDRAPEGL